MKKSNDKRGQAGLILGILAITLVVMLGLFIPAGPRRACLKSQITLDEASADLNTQKLAWDEEAGRLARQKQLMELLAKRPANFDLFAYVDGLLNTQGLRDRAQLDQFKPHNGSAGTPMVQLRLEAVSFDEMIGLFHGLYSGGNLIAVYRMESMRPTTSGKGLDCDVTLVTLAANSAAAALAPAGDAAPAPPPPPAAAPATTPPPPTAAPTPPATPHAPPKVNT